MFLNLHGLQHPPLPISRFLKQDFCPFPVLLVLVFSSHAQLFLSSHPLFLPLTCALLTSSAGFFPSLRLLQSKHGTLYTTPFFITSSCGVCTLVKSSRKVPCDLNTAILDPIWTRFLPSWCNRHIEHHAAYNFIISPMTSFPVYLFIDIVS